MKKLKALLEGFRRGIIEHPVRYFLIGLVPTVAFVGSAFLIVWIWSKISQIFAYPLILFSMATGVFLPLWLGTLIALIVLLVGIAVFGYLLNRIWLFSQAHALFEKVYGVLNPAYKPIKESMKLVVDSLNGAEGLFYKVVLVRSDFLKDGWVYGMVLGDAAEAFETGGPDELINVFVIHGPVGNSGNCGAAPRKNLRIAVNEATGEPISITKFLTECNLRFGFGAQRLLKSANNEG